MLFTHDIFKSIYSVLKNAFAGKLSGKRTPDLLYHYTTKAVIYCTNFSVFNAQYNCIKSVVWLQIEHHFVEARKTSIYFHTYPQYACTARAIQILWKAIRNEKRRLLRKYETWNATGRHTAVSFFSIPVLGYVSVPRKPPPSCRRPYQRGKFKWRKEGRGLEIIFFLLAGYILDLLSGWMRIWSSNFGVA